MGTTEPEDFCSSDESSLDNIYNVKRLFKRQGFARQKVLLTYRTQKDVIVDRQDTGLHKTH